MKSNHDFANYAGDGWDVLQIKALIPLPVNSDDGE